MKKRLFENSELIAHQIFQMMGEFQKQVLHPKIYCSLFQYLFHTHWERINSIQNPQELTYKKIKIFEKTFFQNYGSFPHLLSANYKVTII